LIFVFKGCFWSETSMGIHFQGSSLRTLPRDHICYQEKEVWVGFPWPAWHNRRFQRNIACILMDHHMMSPKIPYKNLQVYLRLWISYYRLYSNISAIVMYQEEDWYPKGVAHNQFPPNCSQDFWRHLFSVEERRNPLSLWYDMESSSPTIWPHMGSHCSVWHNC